ncbi:RagB/SusD family nutrient uptake outer membrane protein [Reichenbachiella ulvae]|uniref:RagB/SusD family nutrient uptake outer membrane protein n=1 Tax=Reichenbachiella ulvae TaxID=2980104 RepID=A0ABT3CNA9_9BACT|nr:RagB/SusD family nutrient uptake outer membrane protein [Reichenbachiella ulvae]MCV9385079.1 RagB/SusD family nutrient uptake outer membrane protein [Reichenbachiella ulvae]
MKSLKYILVVLVLFSAFSCQEDYLELSNPNQPDAAKFWKTEDDFEKGVNAIYQNLYYDGSWLRFASIALDVRGDDVRGDSPWPVIGLAGTFTHPGDELMQQWIWIVFYGGVHRSNLVISKIDDIEWEDTARREELLGQAYFMRAFYNHHLVNFFNNVIIYEEALLSPEDSYRTTTDPAEARQSVIDDFAMAASLLPESYDDPADLGRATKGAAYGYLGKCLLFDQRYTEAADAFEEVMAMGYSLMPNFLDNFTEAYENNAESIFEIQFDRSVGGTELGWVSEPATTWSKTTARAITYAPVGFGWSDVVPTQWAFDQFFVEPTTTGGVDARLDATMFYEYPGATVYGNDFASYYGPGSGLIFPKKYQNYLTIADEFDWRSGINERLLRYADILLMYAECQIELGDNTAAASYIQMIRDRAGLPDREAEMAAMSKAEIFDELAHQRLLEFVFEGHRFDDIRRWGWLQDPTKLAELQSHDSEFNAYVPGREFYFIPRAEIDANPNVEQNPGWNN